MRPSRWQAPLWRDSRKLVEKGVSRRRQLCANLALSGPYACPPQCLCKATSADSPSPLKRASAARRRRGQDDAFRGSNRGRDKTFGYSAIVPLGQQAGESMKLSIGVLVVGSLDWESKEYGEAFRRRLTADDRERIARRTKWRNDRLMEDTASEFCVRVPIRYGRKSITRGGSFTMVFSPEYMSRLGTAKAVRCKRSVISIDDLAAEAMKLWAAESNDTRRGFTALMQRVRRFCASDCGAGKCWRSSAAFHAVWSGWKRVRRRTTLGARAGRAWP